MQWNDSIPLPRLRAESSILPEEFYSRPTVEVARDLLGTVLIHGKTAGRIVEVEAYLGYDDLAAHSARGITPRTRVIFGPPGRAYVYFIYGMYECLNLVAEPDGVPGCVLIRALEPLCGIAQMRIRRPAAKKREQLCDGPAKLTLALGITREQNGVNVTRATQKLQVRRLIQHDPVEIVTTPRIGITKCADWPLRFHEKDSPYVS